MHVIFKLEQTSSTQLLRLLVPLNASELAAKMDAPPDEGESQPVRTRTTQDAGAPDMPCADDLYSEELRRTGGGRAGRSLRRAWPR
ncbi:hypothetical protein FRC10_005540 [Ceratobasidium sp. 414]|nr:hypothetical protein FRC10_005540 [Ceratobasidium sp. 414]